MTLFWFILSLCSFLSPVRARTEGYGAGNEVIARHGQLSTAIADVLEARGPLFRDDPKLHKSAALMVAVSFRESSLDNHAVGDHGRSFCAFQVHSSSGGTKELLEDAHACAERAHAMLKASASFDPSHPVAFYARGPRWNTPEAQRISNDRMYVAKKLLRLQELPQ